MYLILFLIFLEHSALIKSVDYFLTFKEFFYNFERIFSYFHWILYLRVLIMLMLEGLKLVNFFSFRLFF